MAEPPASTIDKELTFVAKALVAISLTNVMLNGVMLSDILFPVAAHVKLWNLLMMCVDSCGFVSLFAADASKETHSLMAPNTTCVSSDFFLLWPNAHRVSSKPSSLAILSSLITSSVLGTPKQPLKVCCTSRQSSLAS